MHDNVLRVSERRADSMHGCSLIVHADDFGLTEKTNEGILIAHKDGIVTATSIMANARAFDHAVGLWHESKTLDVGVHLTLVEERSVLDSGQIPSLVNPDGRFVPHAVDFLKRYLARRVDLDHVRREWRAQIDKVLTAGLAVTHLDSHQHLHWLPGLWTLTVELAREYAISAVRMPAEWPPAQSVFNASNRKRVIQAWLMSALRLGNSRRQVNTPDKFLGFLDGGHLDRARLRSLLERLPASGVCELMCHPGLYDARTPYAHWDYRPSQELDALVDPEAMALVRERCIRLISFRHMLADPGGRFSHR